MPHLTHSQLRIREKWKKERERGEMEGRKREGGGEGLYNVKVYICVTQKIEIVVHLILIIIKPLNY